MFNSSGIEGEITIPDSVGNIGYWVFPRKITKIYYSKELLSKHTGMIENLKKEYNDRLCLIEDNNK